MSSWKKFEGNPVLGNSDLGTCFDVNVIPQDDGSYLMYFSWRPKKSIACVRSTDGIHWSEPVIVLEPDPNSGWEDQLNRTCVIRHNGLHYMWYTGQARGFSRLGCATSIDGLHFTRLSTLPVMIPEFPWEKESVMNPYVLRDARTGLLRMWYAAGETYEPNALGYAESNDGFHWRKSPLNPIFVKGTDACERNRVGGCEVHQLPDGTYAMFYIGYEDIHTARICLAFSPNGITNWTRSAENPIVEPTPDGWDANACYKPSAVRDEAHNRWLLWYNGRKDSSEYIGLVIHDGLDLR